MAEDRMLSDEILLGIINSKSGGGGGGGTDDYNDLKNQPKINNNTLVGNKTASDLGLVAAEAGKGLSTNNYTDADKAIVGGVTAALAGKQNALTAGKYIDIDANNEISVDPVVPNETFKYVLQQIENYTIKVTKSVNNVVVSEKTYGPPTGWDAPVEATLDEAIHIYIHMTGIMFYDLLIASDTHEAGFKQTMSWYGRDTFTENFSTVDHSGEKLIIKSEMDTALALKQDKTDNALQTTDKTVVGAVNELKSGLANLFSNIRTAESFQGGSEVKYVVLGKVVVFCANITKNQSSWTIAYGLPKPYLSEAVVGYLEDNSAPNAAVFIFKDTSDGRLQVRSSSTSLTGKRLYGVYLSE